MRSAFESWASRDGHIVRRREDKPDEYLVFETQRRWVVWQAAIEHGANDTRHGAPKATRSRARALPVVDENALRERVLDEVLDAVVGVGRSTGIDGIVNVIVALKYRRGAHDQALGTC